jgi:hypothetical protein
VNVDVGSSFTVTLKLDVLLQPKELVSVTETVPVPALVHETVIAFVFCPAVIVPPEETVQEKLFDEAGTL